MLEGGGISLERRESSPIPVEADSICPDRFVGLSLAEVAALPAYFGRRLVALGDLFDIDGMGAESITVRGDLRSVKKIGQRMTHGRITLDGECGQHLGAYMTGGEIVVHGDAGDWVGAHMAGGRIVVHGNAGNYAGGVYSGELRGMTGGTIVVHGDVGREAGSRMRRGMLVVFGDTGEFLGARMIAGTILVAGRIGRRPGAGMKRGTIVALGEAPELLPTFRLACCYEPVFLRTYVRRLAQWGLVDDATAGDGVFCRHVGDATTIGKGEILVRDQSE